MIRSDDDSYKEYPTVPQIEVGERISKFPQDLQASFRSGVYGVDTCRMRSGSQAQLNVIQKTVLRSSQMSCHDI